MKKINQDVAGYKDDFFKGLTLRECIFGGTALGLGVGGMLILIFIYNFSINAAIMICIPLIAAVGLCGFYEKNGMTLPQIVKAFIRIKKQKTLTYQTCRPEESQRYYLATKDIKQKDSILNKLNQEKKNGGQ